MCTHGEVVSIRRTHLYIKGCNRAADSSDDNVTYHAGLARVVGGACWKRRPGPKPAISPPGWIDHLPNCELMGGGRSISPAGARQITGTMPTAKGLRISSRMTGRKPRNHRRDAGTTAGKPCPACQGDIRGRRCPSRQLEGASPGTRADWWDSDPEVFPTGICADRCHFALSLNPTPDSSEGQFNALPISRAISRSTQIRVHVRGIRRDYTYSSVHV